MLIVVMALNTVPLALAQSETPATRRQVKPTAPPRTPADSTAAGAQTAAPVETPEMTMCKMQGKSDGKTIKTGGSFAGGFAGGVLLGLIGTGIAVLAQSKPEPPIDKVMAMPADTCRTIYTEAYKSAGKGKKQSSALVGGLVGTAIIVTVILATSSSDE
jgi:hypothetical protein